MRKVMALALVAMLAAGSAFAIEIDGDLLDWSGIGPADFGNVSENLGDMPTGPEFDIQDFYIAADTTNLYVRVDVDPSGTYAGGFTNYENPPAYELWFATNMQDTVGLGWGGFWTFAPEWRIDLAPALDPAVGASEVTVYHYGSDYNGSDEVYDSVGVAQIAVSEDGNAFELALGRDTIDMGLYGGWVLPMCYYVGNDNWDNEEYFPNGAAEGETPYYALLYNLATRQASNLLVGGADWRMDSIDIDGDMLDWDSIPMATTGTTEETTGDSPSGPEFDLTGFKMASDSTNFYGMISIDPAHTFGEGYTNYENPPVFELYIDDSMGDTTGLGWGWWPIGVDYFVELQEATDPSAPADTATVMHYIDNFTAPSAAEWGDNFEITGNATVAVSDDGNMLEFSIPWSIMNTGPYFHIVAAYLGNYDWGNDDFMPNGWNSTTGPVYMLTYSKFDGAMNTMLLADPSVGVEEGNTGVAARPTQYEILSTYPNPFNSTTRVRYMVPQTGKVDVAVYDITGRRVQTLVSGSMNQGLHQAVWQASNVSSGVYFIRVSGDAGSAVARTVLVK